MFISNNISHRDQRETSTGVGLENIQKRYAMITDKKVVVEKTGDLFTVKVPLLKNK